MSEQRRAEIQALDAANRIARWRQDAEAGYDAAIDVACHAEEVLREAAAALDRLARELDEALREAHLLDNHCHGWSRDYKSIAQKLDAAEAQLAALTREHAEKVQGYESEADRLMIENVALTREREGLRAALDLVKEAVNDKGLSDFACRVAIATSVDPQPVTEDDIRWARGEPEPEER